MLHKAFAPSPVLTESQVNVNEIAYKFISPDDGEQKHHHLTQWREHHMTGHKLA